MSEPTHQTYSDRLHELARLNAAAATMASSRRIHGLAITLNEAAQSAESWARALEEEERDV